MWYILIFNKWKRIFWQIFAESKMEKIYYWILMLIYMKILWITLDANGDDFHKDLLLKQSNIPRNNITTAYYQ